VERCYKLKEVILPNITKIENFTFSNCSSLESIFIPKFVTSIGDCAFLKCTNLKNIYYEGTKEEWDKIDISTVGNNGSHNGAGNSILDDATIHYSSSKTQL